MTITLPEQGLVILMGASSSGKSTFAAEHFLPTEIVSSDRCRAMVCDDENDQSSTTAAFELLHTIVRIRLREGRFAAVDATNLRSEDRLELKRIARDQDCLCSLIAFDTPKQVCLARNADRSDRRLPPQVIARHLSMFRQSARALKTERYHRTYTVGPDNEGQLKVVRSKLWTDRRDLTGPFDIIGDLHGCATELEELLALLGYDEQGHPDGRRVIFVGDITDRGPRNLDCYRIVKRMVDAEQALCVAGNHDVKVLKLLQGKNITVAHGLELTKAELEQQGDEFKREMASFLKSLISHYVLDEGRLVVAHAGLKEQYQGRASGRVREFCLYGDTTGEVDEFGLPVRLNWASDYRGQAMVVYGHTPVPEAVWQNRTINIDTGCVFGGALTALRYPELSLLSVPAKGVHCEPKRPLMEGQGPSRDPNEIKLSDLLGKQIVRTALIPNIGIQAEQASSALEVMSRFAIAPEWLLSLPPTMAPCATSERPDYLEYPTEAFNSYRSQGLETVSCQEKHMGSRALLVLRQDGQGRCFTRTGRPFFSNDLKGSSESSLDLDAQAQTLEEALVAHLVDTLEKAGFWADFETDWVCLDAEVMPWSAKAMSLLREQYAAVGTSARHGLTAGVEVLREAQGPLGVLGEALLARVEQRLGNAERFTETYGRYCWGTDGLQGVKLAPFHLLASAGAVHQDKTHSWHLENLQKYLGGSDCFHPTKTLEVDLWDDESMSQGCRWWEEMTEAGGEGMVVKPETFVTFGKKGLVQPAVKVRGREYLRIIYGPDYTEYLPQLRKRGLGRKRSLALREFALGLEALSLYVAGAPLYEVHRCVFAILALESTPIDPRL